MFISKALVLLVPTSLFQRVLSVWSKYLYLKGPCLFASNMLIFKAPCLFGGNMFILKGPCLFGANMFVLKGPCLFACNMFILKSPCLFGGNMFILKGPCIFCWNVFISKDPCPFSGKFTLSHFLKDISCFSLCMCQVQPMTYTSISTCLQRDHEKYRSTKRSKTTQKA